MICAPASLATGLCNASLCIDLKALDPQLLLLLQCNTQPCLHRLAYKTRGPQSLLQVGLSDAGKLDNHSLEELKDEFQRACIKPRKQNITSEFLGVSRTPSGEIIAQVAQRVGGKIVTLFFHMYDDEEEAARAYDRAALQLRGLRHRGRCINAVRL